MQTVTQKQTDIAEETIKALVDGCFMMSYKVHGASGEATISNAQTEIDGEKISNKLVSGTKLQWFPKSDINLNSKFNARLSRLFAEIGVRWGDQYIVPNDRKDHMESQLAQIISDYDDDKSEFISKFQSIVDAHIQANPDIADLIESHMLSSDDFASRFKLVVRPPLKISTVNPEDEEALAATIAESIWDEIETEANSIYSNSWFKNKKPVNCVTQKIRGPLERLRAKLDSLSNIEPKLTAVCFTIVDVFEKLPKTGKIEGHDFQQLTNWMHVMGNRDKLLMHAEGDQVFEYEPPVPQTPAPSVPASQQATLNSNEVVNTESSTSKFDPSQPPSQSTMQNHTMDFGDSMGW